MSTNNSQNNPQDLELLKELYPDTEVVYGTNLFRKLLNRKVTKEMLGDGQAIIENCRLNGDKADSSPRTRIVIYNRDYVFKKLSQNCSELINELSKSEWNELMLHLYHDIKTKNNE